jgi:hypothetical protein
MHVLIEIPQGTVLTLQSGDWKSGTGTLRLQVNRVMNEVRHEPGWVWVEGTRHDNERGRHWLQALVRIDALPTASI